MSLEEKVDAFVRYHPELSEDEIVRRIKDTGEGFRMDVEDIRYRIQMIRGE